MNARDSSGEIGTGYARAVDALVIGAGFAGLYALHRLRLLGFTAHAIEAAPGVGGTWYWNRYPGARVDIESQDYSFSFSDELEAEWAWTERYAAQPELLRYAGHVADRFDLRRDISFNTRVVAMRFGDDGRWVVEMNTGELVSARYVIAATGCLSVPKQVDIAGADSFAGVSVHTGRWPEDGLNLTGRRVGIIGTGSSGIQCITEVAKQAGALSVFQRTANFSVPAHDAPLAPDQAEAWKADRHRHRQRARESHLGTSSLVRSERSALTTPPDERTAEFDRRWAQGGFQMSAAFNDIVSSPAANAHAVEFVAAKIRAVVSDPAVAEVLVPTAYPFGTRRLCVDTGYYETFNRDNVTLVDVAADPIVAIEPDGVRTAAGFHPLDVLIHAVGFDAMTGALLAIDIEGADGVTLRDAWAAGPRSYLGLMVAGFPNLFTVTGPGSPSVFSNMILSIEQHVEWITACIDDLRRDGLDRIEPAVPAQDGWVDHVNAVADTTLLPLTDSWYTGSNIAGKPRVFMPYLAGVGVYRQVCADVVADGYRGFVRTASVPTRRAAVFSAP